MSEPLIQTITAYVVERPRDVPYLGPLADGEVLNERGYVVRKGNGTIYPSFDRSLLVRIETSDGLYGWGETYGLCAPLATVEIIKDLLAPVLKGSSAEDPAAIWQQLYDLMRVRGYGSGFYGDALAALDIALWDLKGKREEKPLAELLGGDVHRPIPGYISGLPEATLDGRLALAKKFADEGFQHFKFAAVVSHEGIVEELDGLRAALGPDAKLAVDLHWKFGCNEAAQLLKDMEPGDLWFAEAPVKPEDIVGLKFVKDHAAQRIAGGEEWRTRYEAQHRLAVRALDILQPEMGHTGVTQFKAMLDLAEAYGLEVIPHATIGVGIFMAASLHTSASSEAVTFHEYQHSVYDSMRPFVPGLPALRDRMFVVPSGHGLGVDVDPGLLERCEGIPC